MIRSSTAALAVVIGCTLPASVAHAEPLHRRALSAAVNYLGVAGPGAVAYIDAAGSTIVRRDDGTTATAPTPSGCSIRAAGGGRLLYFCGAVGDASSPQRQRLLVTTLTGANPASTEADIIVGTEPVTIDFTRVGSAWASAPISSANQSAFYLLNWRTGQTVLQRADALGTGMVDLNQPNAIAPACRPLDRLPVKMPVDPATAPTQTTSAPWALRRTAAGRVELWRCGARRRTRLLSAGSPSRPLTASLAHGWVAWSATRGAKQIDLLRLRDHKHLVFRGHLGTHRALDLTPRNLYVDDVDAQGKQSLSVVALHS
jgi:hypothetical protein